MAAPPAASALGWTKPGRRNTRAKRDKAGRQGKHGGYRRVAATPRALGIDPGGLVQRARELAAVATQAFRAAADAPEVAALGRRLPEALVALIADRARRCLAVLGA